MSMDDKINLQERRLVVVRVVAQVMKNFLTCYPAPRFFFITQGLPPTAKLESAGINPLGGIFELIFSDDSFQPVPTNGIIPELVVAVTEFGPPGVPGGKF